MNISASLRYMDYAARPAPARNVRRLSDDERRNGTARQQLGGGKPREDARGASVLLSPFALPPQTEPAPSAAALRPQTTLDASGILSLIDSAVPAPTASAPASSQAESLYVLLAQVLNED